MKPKPKTKKKKPYIHAPAYTRAELRRLRSIAMTKRSLFYTPGARVVSVSHITPRAYCVAKTASHAAVFVVPPADNEPQVANSNTTTVHGPSCADVKLGDWCALAYVCSVSSGMNVVLEIQQ